jgi:hypothetical protein
MGTSTSAARVGSALAPYIVFSVRDLVVMVHHACHHMHYIFVPYILLIKIKFVNIY